MVNTETRLIIFFGATDGEALYSQQKQDRELTVLQRISLRERERKGEKKKERHGDPSSDGTKVFYSTFCGYLYCLTR